MTATTVIRRGDAVHTVVIDGEAVLLDESDHELHLLNHSATCVWTKLDGIRTLDEVSAALATSFGVAGALLDDVLLIAEAWVDLGLAQIVDAHRQ